MALILANFPHSQEKIISFNLMFPYSTYSHTSTCVFFLQFLISLSSKMIFLRIISDALFSCSKSQSCILSTACCISRLLSVGGCFLILKTLLATVLEHCYVVLFGWQAQQHPTYMFTRHLSLNVCCAASPLALIVFSVA